MDDISLTTILMRNPEQIFSMVDNEVVMLNVKEGKYFALNEVGARIWELLENPITVETLINKLSDEFDISKINCEIDTLAFLTELFENKLVIQV